uniref:Prepro-agatoxin-like peptide isoform 1 n=1 Tax=Homarus americanus TaxID=6706 RepID=A0A7G3S422_HOMAM|nr:prepro-agatoxin-like peptide isoform 1 [Homarus americanus]
MGSKVLVMLLALALVLSVVMAQPLLEEGREEDGVQQAEPDYAADLLERLLARTQKRDDVAGSDPIKRWRSCIRRGGMCDHRPNDCCYNSSCRCNLWGTNCRCQRMGIFQQWGK